MPRNTKRRMEPDLGIAGRYLGMLEPLQAAPLLAEIELNTCEAYLDSLEALGSRSGPGITLAALERVLS